MIGLALASVSVPKALAILGIVAILVASVWVCVDEYRHAPLWDFEFDHLTDDGPDEVLDPDPETTALIARIDRELQAESEASA